jgi:hypothetical protein
MASVVVCGALQYTLRSSPDVIAEVMRQHWDRELVIFERGEWDAKKKAFIKTDEVRLRVGAISAVWEAT